MDVSLEIAVAGIRFLRVDQIVSLLSLVGVVLNALGGLYLAYDLLGAKRGPLRLLARLFTYSAILGLGYGVLLGLWFGLDGAFLKRTCNCSQRTLDWYSYSLMCL